MKKQQEQHPISRHSAVISTYLHSCQTTCTPQLRKGVRISSPLHANGILMNTSGFNSFRLSTDPHSSTLRNLIPTFESNI